MKLKLALLSSAALLLGGLALQAAPADWVGKQMPDLGVQYEGTAPALSGKPAIVEFWATWCPPCRKSIPHLNDLNAKFKDKGLVIVGITDEDKATVEKFQKSLPMSYPVGYAKDSKLAEKFGIEGIPQAFIVDKTGKIVWEGHPMTMKEEDVAKVLP